MTAEDMGVTADADTAVQEALAVGHAGSLINRYKNPAGSQKEKTGSRYASECKQTGDGRKDI